MLISLLSRRGVFTTDRRSAASYNTTMIARGCLVLVILVNYVFTLPVSPNHVENEDVQVMKCIMEVLADTLSKPHPLPVSQECLETLRTSDERLVSILRHRNLLRELQDIAVEGANERTHQQQQGVVDHVTNQSQVPQGVEGTADQSTLVTVERPGETPPVAEKKGAGEEAAPGSLENGGESRQGDATTSKEGEGSEEEENPNNHISDSMNREEEDEEIGAPTKKEEEEEEEEKHSSSEEDEEEDLTLHKAVGESAAETDAPGENSEAKKSAEEESEEEQEQEQKEEKRTFGSEEAGNKDEEEDEKRDVGAKRWSRMSKLSHSLQTKKRAEGEGGARSAEARLHQEAPHHSKEVVVGEEVRRSPEEQELQMMARREPEERRDEEGSASRKAEDPEIESLAAIESELESVALKLHELRRG